MRERSERRERTGSSDAVADDFGDLVSALVTMLARLSRPGLPTVIVIEDLHDADPMLAELLTTLVASSAAVMIVSTGWPGHLSESPALTDAMAAAGGRLVRISSDAAAPPPAPFPPESGLGRMPDDARASIVRFYYPAVEDQTLAMLVDRYANPLVLELFCQLPVYRRKYADGALKLTAADVAALPATVRELYRQLWSELPESVRHALTIATLGIPSVIDPKGGRSADWNQSLMLEIIEAIGLPNGEEVERSLDEAPTVYAWARTVTETLRRFAEHDQLAVASDDQRDFLDEGDIRDIKNALASRLATRLLDDPGSRSSEEIEHSARLVLALHAEGFIDDGEVVAAATLALIRILADLPRERAELIRIADRALRESDPRTPNGRAIRLELMIALRLTGRADRAVELARELDAELTAANADSAEVRAVRIQLCASLGDAGHNAEALELARGLVETNAAGLGPHHPDTFKARNLLVIETSVVDSAESAIPLQESLVADMAAVLAVGDRLRIRGDANLASYYSRADRPHDALRLQSAACAAAVEHLGPVDEDTMLWKQDLAGYLADAGQLVAATAMRRELLADISATLGDDHPAARDALSSLSLALGQAAQREESIALAREFVARTSSAYGERTRRTLDALSTLAGLQRDAADYEGAIATATRARSIAIGLADSTFADIVWHESLIALAVGEMQSPEAAVALLEPLLQRAQQELGPTHFITLGLMNNMGHFYGRAGRPEDAIAVLHELVALRRELPMEARNLSDDVVQLAYLYRSIRLADSSVNFLVPLIETMTDRFGATSVPAVNLRIELIDSLIADNRAAEARALAEALVVELDQVYPRWHALVFSARTSLAVSIEATGEVEEAMIAYRSLVDEAEGHLGVTDPMTLGSIDMLMNFADQPNGFSARVIADIERLIDPIRAALAPSVRFSRWLVRAVSIAVRADRYDLALEWGTECIAGLRDEQKLPADQKDAYFQLVLHPILACANLNAMYVAQGKNSRYASQGRASTNTMASKVNDAFTNDTTITNRYHAVNAGKWNHMMDQTHIGYTTWDQPASQVRPSTQTISATGAAAIGVSIEGATAALIPSSAAGTLPELSAYYPQEARYIEVFNRGAGSFDYQAKSDAAYVTITPASGTLSADLTLEVKADFSQVPAGKSTATITVTGAGGDVDLKLPLNNPASPSPASLAGFPEVNGRVSLDASHYSANVKKGGVGWSVIPDLGRTGNGVHIQPDDAASLTPGTDSPHLEYKLYLAEAGQVQAQVYLSPSLPASGSHYRYAVSFDDQAPQTVDIHSGLPNVFNDTAPVWEGWVSDNIIVKSTNLTPSSAGEHTLKLWMVDSGVVVQKIVVSRGTLPSSYLGAPTRLPLNTTLDVVIPDRGTPDPAGGAAGGSSNGGSNAGANAGANAGSNAGSDAGASATTGGNGPAVGDSAGGPAASGGLGASAGSGGVVQNGGPGSAGTGTAQPGAPSSGQSSNGSSGCSIATPGSAPGRHGPVIALGLLLASWSAARRSRRVIVTRRV